jgi:hypothetical protein
MSTSEIKRFDRDLKIDEVTVQDLRLASRQPPCLRFLPISEGPGIAAGLAGDAPKHCQKYEEIVAARCEGFALS